MCSCVVQGQSWSECPHTCCPLVTTSPSHCRPRDAVPATGGGMGPPCDATEPTGASESCALWPCETISAANRFIFGFRPPFDILCILCQKSDQHIYFMLAQNKTIIYNLYLYFSAYKLWFPSQLFPAAESPVTGTKPTDSWYQHYCKVRQQLASSRRSEMLSTFCTAPSFTF